MADRLALVRRLALALPFATLAFLWGCSASMVKIVPGTTVETTTVIVNVARKDTGKPIAVKATVICGGVRATLLAAQSSVTVTGVPLVTASGAATPSQPLTVTARGFVTSFQTLQLNTAGSTTVTVQLTAADLHLTGTVTGKVSSTTKAGITNATVQFRPNVTGTTVLVEGATDSTGAYVIGGIPTGSDKVDVAVDGYLPVVAQTVVVVQDAGSKGNAALNFKLVPTSSKVAVSGRVIDLITRADVAGAKVTIASRPAVQTRSDGSFTVADVPVGDQTVAVTAKGYSDYSRTFSIVPGMADLQLEIAPNSSKPPGGPSTISGTVTVRNRATNAGVTVRAVETATNQVMDQTQTDATGTYGLFVPPGKYRIEVSLGTVSISRVVTLGGAGRVLTGIDFEITAP